MSPDWVAEELRLWNAMMYTSYDIADTRRNQGRIRQYRAAHPTEKNIVKIREALGLMTVAEADRESWKRFERWREH